MSHDHSDHVKGVGVLSRKYKIPVWMNRGTSEAARANLGNIHRLEHFETGRIFSVGKFKIHPFSVPHDCADPVGFRISMGTWRLGIATDSGHYHRAGNHRSDWRSRSWSWKVITIRSCSETALIRGS